MTSLFTVEKPDCKAAKAWTPTRVGFQALAALSCAFIAMSLDTATAADPAISYNEGVDLYRAGKFDQAADKFRRATAADATSLAAQARYNLGNTYYARAVAGLRSQPPEQPADMIKHLRSAITHYASSLRLNPRDDDARTNIELAKRLIERLEKEQQKQEQPKEQNQQSEQKSSEQEKKGQKDEGQENENQQDGEEQDAAQQQQDGKAETKPGEKAGQQSDQESNTESQPAEPDKTQQGELKTDDESAEQSANPSDGKPKQTAFERPDQMSDQEAEKLLQLIRDRDMLRRMRREAARRARRIPVPQDW